MSANGFTLRKFDLDTDLDLLNDWLLKRDLPLCEAERLPARGYVLSHGELVSGETKKASVPTAMGFLRKVEGDMAWLDSFVTNPNVSSSIRHEGMDLLTDTLLHLAEELQIREVIAWSVDHHTVLRAMKHGFKKVDQVFLVKKF